MYCTVDSNLGILKSQQDLVLPYHGQKGHGTCPYFYPGTEELLPLADLKGERKTDKVAFMLICQKS